MGGWVRGIRWGKRRLDALGGLAPAPERVARKLLVAAVNAAGAKSKEQMKDEMMKMTGGLNIPGLEQISKMLK